MLRTYVLYAVITSRFSVRFNAINEDDVVQFLNANPDTISHYVKQYVDVPTIKVCVVSIYDTIGTIEIYDLMQCCSIVLTYPHFNIRAILL